MGAAEVRAGASPVRAADLACSSAADATSIGAAAGQDRACLAADDTSIVHAAATAGACCCCTAHFPRATTGRTYVVAADSAGIAGRPGGAASLAGAPAVRMRAAGVAEQCRAKHGGEKT